MGRWQVVDEASQAVFVAESLPDGLLSLHIPTPGALIVTAETAERIRLVIGTAIGEAHYKKRDKR